MLQIQNIKKQYVTGELVQTALDGVSLTLRDNEFVAILGPSGSGKTTLLNIIGGLDRYDSGDLVINGISTKKYSDRDWDSYRNHTIGFVFQSYNLIPHQSVLANVELALTISGISRGERRRRAAKALEDVGLGNQLHKRPNQMSGGQMQRVAIARALVNNPDILLADEPTGALDSETSIQVMELLKEVSRDRLVVMVTHNPELAETYANRIVRVRDGRIIDDSNPYYVDADGLEAPKHKNMGRASMSFFTALSLSFNNLRTKKGRTILTAFAGSIGIIGIALILSLSTGFQKYIDKIQADTLSNYPLSIQSETADIVAAMAAFGTVMSAPEDVQEGTVVEQQMIAQMFAQVGSNDLSSFKTYLEENFDSISDCINDVKYSYGIRPLIYTVTDSDEILQVNPGNLFGDMTGSLAMSAYMDSNIFYEMIDNYELLDSQYDVLQGRWPDNANELIVVLSNPNQISDYMAYTLGLKKVDGLKAMIEKVMQGLEAENDEEQMRWTYDDLMSLDLRLVHGSQKYRYNHEYSVWEDMSSDKTYIKSLVENAEHLRIVGIVCPKEGISATTLSAGIAYTKELSNKVIETAAQSQIVINQLGNMQLDVFTGKSFTEQEDEQKLDFQNMISVDEEKLTSAFGMDIDESAIVSMFKKYMNSVVAALDVDTEPAQRDFVEIFTVLSEQMLAGYLAEHADDETGAAEIKLADTQAIIDEYLQSEAAQQYIRALEKKYKLSSGTLELVYRPLLAAQITYYIATNMDISERPDVPEIIAPGINEDNNFGTEEEPIVQTDEEDVPVDDPVDIPDENEPSEPSDDPILPEIPDENLPEIEWSELYAVITKEQIALAVSEFSSHQVVTSAAAAISGKMMEATLQKILSNKLAAFGPMLMQYIGSSFYVDEQMLSEAFQFNMNEDDLKRLMDAMSGKQTQRSADANLKSLGYADLAKPTSISVYFVDFTGKEEFLSFLDNYNEDMKSSGMEEQVISYTDMTGIMMSSVRTIIDSVSYVLIAFVAVSLIVSSIMIGIITYISVMERTKEIGVLRAIGASKRNISQVFNAETFIIGLCSGLIGIGSTLIFNIPINKIIYALTDNPNIQAQLPPESAVILVILSMVLTLIGGLIPSKQAAKKDPVIALRSE